MSETPVTPRLRAPHRRRRSPYLRTDYRRELTLFPYSGPRLAVIALTVLGLVAFPYLSDAYWLGVVNLAMIAAVGALGLQIVTGMAGQLSLGHAAFLAVGGFFAAGLYLHLGLPLWLAGPAAMLAGATVGAIAGLPALRIRGFYLGITTLAVQYVIIAVGLKYQGYLQTAFGTTGSLTLPVPDIGLFTLTTIGDWYYFLLVLGGVVVLAVTNLKRSALGRSLLAVRQRELAAEALGVNVARVKITAFALSGALGGLCGALSAYYYRGVGIEDFDLLLSVEYLAMIIVGGLGSVLGAVLGAVFVIAMPLLVGQLIATVGLEDALSQHLRAIELAVFAITMMGFLLFEPDGLAGVWARVRTYFTRWPFKYTGMSTQAKR
jgi:branched-chain amino acid transport system permease protein